MISWLVVFFKYNFRPPVITTKFTICLSMMVKWIPLPRRESQKRLCTTVLTSMSIQYSSRAFMRVWNYYNSGCHQYSRRSIDWWSNLRQSEVVYINYRLVYVVWQKSSSHFADSRVACSTINAIDKRPTYRRYGGDFGRALLFHPVVSV